MEKSRVHAILMPFLNSTSQSERNWLKHATIEELSELVELGYIQRIVEEGFFSGVRYSVTELGRKYIDW